ncbi:MAG: protein-L-isoaspartate O-methyltransferase [Candidatus Omnitrophica bacterium 4484_171]|nr:MAG: protein-L-isoaspartate O-methyltransferase [Candidatus Omnitrophica bacterium 4484_171]
MNFASLRGRMVTEQIIRRGISDRNVVSAFKNIPRELFVPDNQRNFAYDDRPLSIGKGQTISQPYIAALMTSVLYLEKNNKVLEIGTGSGYQSAILSYLGAELYTVERIPELAEKAATVLNYLGFNVNIKIGDGTLGWHDYSPYDRIIVTAASEILPAPLIGQLKAGGRIVAPVGGKWQQELIIFEKTNEGLLKKTFVCGCVFVPLVGKYGYKK